jgi:hypothetical protein
MTKTHKLEAIRLEDRATPATFGVPWPDSSLSLSFAPDGTTIAGRTSNLFHSLNQDASPEHWQREILRAFYTWSSRTNINIGVVPDSGAAFGTAGRLQNDPRFGDIRIGGNRLVSDVLAVTSSSDPGLAGTLAGDLFINTNYRFQGQPYDLYRVALHEAGHAFGLDHSADPASPMFPRFNNSVGALTAGDIDAIQSLYGPRQRDRFEGRSGNGTIATATAIPVPTGYTGRTPLLAFADLTNGSDVDHFWFDTVPTPNGDDNVTVRVRSAGISLVGAKVTVFRQYSDGSTSEVANVTSDSADYAGDDLSVTFDGSDDDQDRRTRYIIRIERSESAPFAVGNYALAVTFSGANQIPIANVDRVMLGHYEQANANDLARLLADPNAALVNLDRGTNDTPATASFLPYVASTTRMSRSEGIGSLDSTGDVDAYRIVTPNLAGEVVLRANAWTVTGTARPALSIADTDGNLLPSTVLVNHDGTYSIQATGLLPNAAYIVSVANRASNGIGNYVLTVDCGSIATSLQPLTEGTLPTAGTTRTDTLYIGQSQLFHFVLAADALGVPPAASVTMTLRDVSGNILTTITARAGESVSAPAVWLRPGEYRVSFHSTGHGSTPLRFALRGNRLTDPVGPVVEDPTLEPTYRDPQNPNQFQYPGLIVTTAPFFWLIGIL